MQEESVTDFPPSQVFSTTTSLPPTIKPENPTLSNPISAYPTALSTPEDPETPVEEKKELNKWWAYLVSKLEAAKAWAEDLVSGMRAEDDDPGSGSEDE